MATLDAVDTGVPSTPARIASLIRRTIGSGELPVGSRLPPSAALARQWGVSLSSVQTAMLQLKAAGLVDRQQRRGTFVADRRQTGEMAILVGDRLSDEVRYFDRVLVDALRDNIGCGGWHCTVQDDLNRHTKLGMSALHTPAYSRFVRDARAGAFRGFIQVGMGGRRSEELAIEAGIPSVRISTLIGHSDLMYDYYSFGYDAVAWAVRGGWRRIEVFGCAPGSPAEQGVQEAIVRHGLPEPHREPGGVRDGELFENAIHGRISARIDAWRRATAHPQVLVVADDIAMRTVALALLQGGVAVPGSLRVFTLANAGIDLHYGIPVARYEFAPREMARTAVKLLADKLEGRPQPPQPIMIRGRIVEADRTNAPEGIGDDVRR